MASRWPALQSHSFRRLLFTRLSTTAAVNAQAVALGWHIYSLSHSTLDLAMIGLVQFAPALLLILLTGAVADRYPRQRVMTVCLTVMAISSATLALAVITGVTQTWIYLSVLAVFSTGRAFLNPAQQSLVPNVVPAEHLGNAVATNSIATRTAQAIGPVLGGAAYAALPVAAFLLVAAMLINSAFLSWGIKGSRQQQSFKRLTAETLSAGFRFIWATRPILGGVTLDILVIVFGSVTALLPVLAYEVLRIGPGGLGMLRAAPALGGIAAALYFSVFSVKRGIGLLMFAMVALFGIASMVVGLSNVLWLSLVALLVMGAADMASVYIRWTLIQLWTPDEVRGRVAAVTGAAAMGSNDLGDFRSGVSAAAFGVGPAIISGGIMILVVAAVWSRLFPSLMQVRDFEQNASRIG